MAKEVTIRVALFSSYKPAGMPQLFIDVPVQSNGDVAKDEKKAIGYARAALNFGKPEIVKAKKNG